MRFLEYVFFPPLYLAGPTLTFNAFASQRCSSTGISARQVLHPLMMQTCFLVLNKSSLPLPASGGPRQPLAPDRCQNMLKFVGQHYMVLHVRSPALLPWICIIAADISMPYPIKQVALYGPRWLAMLLCLEAVTANYQLSTCFTPAGGGVRPEMAGDAAVPGGVHAHAVLQRGAALRAASLAAGGGGRCCRRLAICPPGADAAAGGADRLVSDAACRQCYSARIIGDVQKP